MLIAALVEASAAVAATSRRKEKTALLAALLAELPVEEIEPAVSFLVGEPRQGRVGIGWATMANVDVEPAAEATLHVAELDAAIAEAATLHGPGSTAARSDRMHALLARATADEATFIRNLMTGGLRQGALAGLMAEAVAKASGVPATVVRRGAMLSGDLPSTARIAIAEGRAAVEAIELTVMVPVSPMLAATSTSAAEAIADVGEASVEWKLDGIRIQVHREGDEVLIVSRNLNDVTDRLGEVVDLVRAMPARSLILDGEAIGWHGDQPEAFQDTASRFGRESAEDHQFRLEARFFDVLHRDGVDLLDAPLHERRAQLVEVAGPHAMPGEITDVPERAEALFASAVDAGHEGVMVKAVNSTYAAGRRGKEWRKVKPVHTLDLVVLGAEWGHGRRQGWLSNLHLGARDGDDFVMVGKTFKGLTDELLRWQTEAFLARKVSEQTSPRNVVFVRPELVVEIALDGAQRSTRYPGGVALRFARVKRYRTDKEPGQADTIEAVRALLH